MRMRLAPFLWRLHGATDDLLVGGMPQIDRRLWRSLSPLLDEALDLDTNQRAAFLASVRSTDLQAATVLEALLSEHDRVVASDFLAAPPIAPDAVVAPLAGQTIGAYMLERPLGMGGMGTVWLARRSDGQFEGHVALKLLNLAVFDAVARRRFAREGTLLARVAHPHIARLFDAGVTAAGQPFLVLEYVNGTRIDDYADTHRLDVPARLELFLQVADAVAHAHANLVVHRDLKPSNILVDDSGRVKLLDFGIAKLIHGEDGPERDALTVLTAPALTPRYAAPEQVSGDAVTTAADVYALGVLLYEMLAGRHPTLQDEVDPVSQVRALVEREPPRVSDAVRLIGADRAAALSIAAARGTSLERLRRACRGDLDTIVAKALKKAPAERYPAVTAFADDVRHHLRSEPVAARPDSVLYRTKKFTARHRPPRPCGRSERRRGARRRRGNCGAAGAPVGARARPRARRASTRRGYQRFQQLPARPGDAIRKTHLECRAARARRGAHREAICE
jgi:serine/threonine protein kinase